MTLRNGLARRSGFRYVTGMAPLNNAERQALYRQRLKHRASLEGLPGRVGEAVDFAVEALWSSISRPDAEGRLDAALDHFSNAAELRSYLALEPGRLADWCRDALRDPESLLDHEAKALRALVEIADAIDLTADRPAKLAKRGSRDRR